VRNDEDIVESLPKDSKVQIMEQNQENLAELGVSMKSMASREMLVFGWFNCNPRK